jgi:hypothetical protein
MPAAQQVTHHQNLPKIPDATMEPWKIWLQLISDVSKMHSAQRRHRKDDLIIIF